MRAQSQAIVIAGPAGALEALLEEPPGAAQRGCVVICHPHPRHGGTMHNKVVHTLARAFQELGYGSLRFNYRGVGASAGQHSDGVGETADALAVCDWLAARQGAQPFAIAGFSFGGAVAFNVAVARTPQLLVTVAPAVDRVTVSSGVQPHCPWQIVQGSADEVVPVARVQSWAAGFKPPPALMLLPGVGHFFHGSLNELRTAVREFALQAKKSPVL